MASKVDFYILGAEGARNRFQYACRLVQKAYQQGNRVFVYTGNEKDGDEFDQLLWTFSQSSFIPHAKTGEAAGSWDDFPVQIGCKPLNLEGVELLINLADAPDIEVNGWGRIAEVVSADENVKAAARDRFRKYREHGMDPDSHHIG